MDLFKRIDEALDLRGRAPDLRGKADDRGRTSSEDKLGVKPGGWTFEFGDHEYGEDTPLEVGGPIPVFVCGHRDLSNGEFAELMEELHKSTYSRQTEEPATFMSPSSESVDARDFVVGGQYHKAAMRRAPSLVAATKKVCGLIDDLATFSTANLAMTDLLDSAVKFHADELAGKLEKLLELTKEDDLNRNTLGDIINNRDNNWPNRTQFPL